MKNTKEPFTNNADADITTAALKETHTILEEFVQLYNVQNFEDASTLTVWKKEKLKELFSDLGKIQLEVLEVKEKDFVRIAKVSVGLESYFLKGYFLLYKYFKEWLISNFFRDYRKAAECTERWSPASVEKLQSHVNTTVCKGLGFLSDIAEKKSIILLGETHYAEQICKTMSSIITVLHRSGYNNLIIEKPSSLEYYCNKYLQTGDQSYYRYTLDEGNFLRTLWEYSQNLPPHQRFNVWCVDTELVPSFVFIRLDDFLKRLSDIFPTKSVRERLPLWVNNVDVLPEVLKNIDAVIRNRKPHIPEDMRDEYFKICDWIKELQEFSGQKMEREEVLKRRVARIYEELKKSVPNPKIIGCFGAEHVAKTRIDSQSPENLGEFLSQRYNPSKGKIYSLRLLPYQGKIYKSIDNNKKIYIRPIKYSIEDILASAMQGDLLFVDLKPFRDHWFYDNMTNWISYKYYDGILLQRDVTCATRNI